MQSVIVGSSPNPHLVISKWISNGKKSPFEITENAHLLLIDLIENVCKKGAGIIEHNIPIFNQINE